MARQSEAQKSLIKHMAARQSQGTKRSDGLRSTGGSGGLKVRHSSKNDSSGAPPKLIIDHSFANLHNQTGKEPASFTSQASGKMPGSRATVNQAKSMTMRFMGPKSTQFHSTRAQSSYRIKDGKLLVGNNR